MDQELFDPLWEVEVLVERWRQTYNRIRPHSALGYRSPAPEAVERYCPDSHSGRYNYRGQVTCTF